MLFSVLFSLPFAKLCAFGAGLLQSILYFDWKKLKASKENFVVQLCSAFSN
jgi:hypothetical protein